MNIIKKCFHHDLIRYLIAGVITTLFYLLIRTALFNVTNQALFATALANGLAILLAFVLNDSWVFAQLPAGRLVRLVKFFLARLSSMAIDVLLTLLLVTSFPNIIGQFVNNDLKQVNLIVGILGQVLIVLTNYLISKFLIFKS